MVCWFGVLDPSFTNRKHYGDLVFVSMVTVHQNTNVIMVDWKEGAGRLNYAQSRANTRVVGRELGKLIEKLKSSTGASYGSMHIIGHSLGAHTSGYAGEARSGVGRISGGHSHFFKIYVFFTFLCRLYFHINCI